MSRIPPSLLYLTIYNPTLRPSNPVAPDDEDAEEQAHVLFYTARERAVSRDRILRQVGLAKALINFSRYVRTVLEKVCSHLAQACSTRTTNAKTYIHNHGVWLWFPLNQTSGYMQ